MAWALLVSAFLGRLLGGLPGLVTVFLGIAAGLILLLAVWRREWEVTLHAIADSVIFTMAPKLLPPRNRLSLSVARSFRVQAADRRYRTALAGRPIDGRRRHLW